MQFNEIDEHLLQVLWQFGWGIEFPHLIVE
jgi:hypothetical protein